MPVTQARAAGIPVVHQGPSPGFRKDPGKQGVWLPKMQAPLTEVERHKAKERDLETRRRQNKFNSAFPQNVDGTRNVDRSIWKPIRDPQETLVSDAGHTRTVILALVDKAFQESEKPVDLMALYGVMQMMGFTPEELLPMRRKVADLTFAALISDVDTDTQKAVMAYVDKLIQQKPCLIKGYDPRIPRAMPTKSLSLTRTGGDFGGAIQARLKQKSPWYASINDPLRGADCKIPDAVGEATGTLQIVQKNFVQTNTYGVTGARMVCPWINLMQRYQSPPINKGVNYQILHTASNQTSLAWGDGTNAGFEIGFEFDGSADIRGATNLHRVVSACLIVEHEASAMTNEGEITLFAFPYGRNDSPLYADMLNAYSSITVPLNANKPAMIKWFPLSAQVDMQSLYNSEDPEFAETFSYKDFISTDGTFDLAATPSEVNPPPAWTLGFVTSGCAQNVALRYQIVVNYEFLPLYNTLNILSASPSPVDLEEEQLVTSWVEEMPLAQPISETRANSSPQSVSPQHGEEPTGFGMIANVIGEVVKFLPLLGL